MGVGFFFGEGVTSHPTILTQMDIGNGDGLQLLTDIQHSWLLSSDGSFACHTYVTRIIRL